MPARPQIAQTPIVLYHASLERIDHARLAVAERRWVIGIYLCGLGVECILQAIALRLDPTHDARHDLNKWLSRCPASLRASLRTNPLRTDWSLLADTWYNGMRYLSDAGLLGYLRRGGLADRIRGGREAILKVYAQSLLAAAERVHRTSVTAWHHS